MNSRTRPKHKRSVSSPFIRPLACAFGVNEAAISSGSESEMNARRSAKSMVHIDIPKKLKESLTLSDDNDSILKLKRRPRRRASRKMPKKEHSTRTLQTVSVSSASVRGSVPEGRSCYRLPSRKNLPKKLSSRKNVTAIKDSRDDDDGIFRASSSSSSSCLTDPSHNDASIESNAEVRDKYEVNETVLSLATEWHHDAMAIEDEAEEDVFRSIESFQIQDCVEEQDALVLQLHIPTHTQDPIETLDVEYLPFKIPVLKTPGVV